MMFTTKKLFLTAVAVAACAAIAAGCGSSSTTTSSSSDSSSGAYGAAKTTKTTTASASQLAIGTKSSKLGTILAGSGGKTLYLFEADKGGKSACSGACAAAWPPAVSSSSVKATGDAKQSLVGSIKRDDGTTQATYAGHPLYYYVKDADAGDTYGNGVEAFGAEWYAMTPAGKSAG